MFVDELDAEKTPRLVAPAFARVPVTLTLALPAGATIFKKPELSSQALAPIVASAPIASITSFTVLIGPAAALTVKVVVAAPDLRISVPVSVSGLAVAVVTEPTWTMGLFAGRPAATCFTATRFEMLLISLS